METFEGMFDKEVSVQLAKKNSMGLADMLVKNLEQQQANIATTADILKQRQDPAALNATKPFPLNPQAVGMPLDKVLNPKQNGFTLPKAASGYMLTAPPKFLLGGDK
jgi:Rod binding domain-containing protein